VDAAVEVIERVRPQGAYLFPTKGVVDVIVKGVGPEHRASQAEYGIRDAAPLPVVTLACADSVVRLAWFVRG
jgi:hypothetical protein